jgi:uncharacterized protein YgbK (DUF1537 family)
MIAVIADDFTGAAETGGVGLRYGLRVVIDTKVREHEDADLIVITTNTRSLPPAKAARKIEQITGQLLRMEPEFIYKKLDSVLRGNIAREIHSQMRIEGKDTALLIPGNPAMGRTIRDGCYFINGIPLHETPFAAKEDFPGKTSLVTEILGRSEIGILSRNHEQGLPGKGIIVGDVSVRDDMIEWTGKLNKNVLAAGGAGFFYEILGMLQGRHIDSGTGTSYLRGRTLFVLGSRYQEDESKNNGDMGDRLIRSNMPEAIYRNREFTPDLMDAWAGEIIRDLEADRKVAILVDHEMHHEDGLSKRIRKNTGQLVGMIMKQARLDNLLIEGGATAWEILKNLKIKKLYPTRELSRGIIQMRPERYPDLQIITKPGSYRWPDNMFNESGERNPRPEYSEQGKS